MSIRPIKMQSQATPTMEGAGVHLHRVFGFGDTDPFDPFLMMDDFRNDKKWIEYVEWADRFYFGVAYNFPIDILPEKHGIIITDGFDCHEVRASPVNKLNGSRRNTLIRNIAKTSMRRIESKRNDLLHF